MKEKEITFLYIIFFSLKKKKKTEKLQLMAELNDYRSFFFLFLF